MSALCSTLNGFTFRDLQVVFLKRGLGAETCTAQASQAVWHLGKAQV